MRISAAAAEVAPRSYFNILQGRNRVMLQQVHARHDHARRAITALGGVVLNEGFLNRM